MVVRLEGEALRQNFRQRNRDHAAAVRAQVLLPLPFRDLEVSASELEPLGEIADVVLGEILGEDHAIARNEIVVDEDRVIERGRRRGRRGGATRRGRSVLRAAGTPPAALTALAESAAETGFPFLSTTFTVFPAPSALWMHCVLVAAQVIAPVALSSAASVRLSSALLTRS